MRIAPQNYTVWPSLFPAHKTAHLTVTATEPAFFPKEKTAYRLRVNSVDNNAFNVYADGEKAFTWIDVIPKDGKWEADFTFSEEGPYSVTLFADDKQLCRMEVYALEPDLYERRPLLGDLHIHSYRSDGARCPMAQPGHYRSEGYEFMYLTDHNRYAPSEEAQDAYEGVKLGLGIYRGEEVHTPGSCVHIVHAGGSYSVADIYYNHPDVYEKGLEEARRRVPDSVPEECRERYARALWATDEIHKAGGLAIFPHPYWIPGKLNAYNVETDFAKILLKSGMFDAFELFGGVGELICLQEMLYNDLLREGVSLPVVGSSDTHEKTDLFNRRQTIVFAKEFSNEGIKEAIKSGFSVALRKDGYGEKINTSFYGTVRLTKYAIFLEKNYYNRLTEIVSGEGMMMRQYLVGECDGKLLSSLSERGNEFYARFSGKAAVPVPSAKILRKEKKWRRVQIKSPDGKGSELKTSSGIPNRQI